MGPPRAPPDIIHKFIRDNYSKRFPELESLVPNALDYIRTVKVPGGGLLGLPSPPPQPRGSHLTPSPFFGVSPPLQELGNSLDKCKNNENVQQILTNATIMVVSVTASTTQG